MTAVNDLPIETHFEKCGCGKRIVIQILLNGTSHNLGLSIICSDCVKAGKIDSKYKNENPEMAKTIEEWARKE